MDEQQKHPETSRTPAPAQQPSGATGQSGSGGKRHRGRTIGLIVAALVVAGIVVWRWHPWGGAPAGGASTQSEGGGRHGRGGAGAFANQPQPVHVATATQGDMPVVLTALGTVTPLATVTVQTQLSGTLQTVAFQEGQMVRKDDLLAQIDPRPYQISLENAQGTLARDQALLQTARLDLKRYQTLLAQDSIASQQVDTQASLVQQYIGTVKSDQANIDTYKLDLIYARITAPVAGRVGLRQVDPGNYVTPNLTNGLVVITQLQPISVIFFILRPVATTLLMVAIMLVGIVAFSFLPLSALPEVDYPTIQVQTFYPGASPEVMTSSVTAPLERAVRPDAGPQPDESTSSAGASVITLQFSLDLARRRRAGGAGRDQRRRQPAAADLPAPPIYAKVNPADAPILTLALTSKTMPLTRWRTGDTRSRRRSRSSRRRPGQHQRRPAAGGAHPGQSASAGRLRPQHRRSAHHDRQRQRQHAEGQFRRRDARLHDQRQRPDQSADDYKNADRRLQERRAGAAQRRRHVVDGAENTKLGAWMNTTPAIILNVQRQPGANVIDVVDSIKALLPQLQAALPAAIDVRC
jgi:hypothetical protein